MAKASDRLHDWWEGLRPRERTMMMALGITAVICVLGFIGITISNGLARIEKRNDDMNEALQIIHRQRLEGAKGRAAKAKQVEIPSESTKVDLDSYLSKIAKDVGVTFPKFNSGKLEEGDLTIATGRIELKDINIAQLGDFLQRIESNPVVVVRELRVKKDFRDKEKIDVPELVVATYFKKSAEPEGEGDGEGEAQEGGEK